MKKLLLLLGVLSLLSFSYASAELSKKTEELELRSTFSDPDYTPDPTSYPTNFQEIGNPDANAAISTGYYFVDSEERSLPDFWRPEINVADTSVDRHLWKLITPGPRVKDSTYWAANPDEGLAFFRNPALPLGDSYFKHGIAYGTDSSDNAIAGPIPLGLAGGFYFNGLRYDSFYVSTNGIIALTNRRYLYNSAGVITQPPGATSAYDPMSMDWFATGRDRASAPTGLEANRLADDFGYQYSVLGDAPTNQTGGIRANGSANGLKGLNPAHKAAVIAPFWGSLHLSQWNPYFEIPEQHGKVYFKRSNASDKLTIYFVNIQPLGTMAVAGSQYTANKDIRLGLGQNYIDASAQVILNRLDSSITIMYEKFTGVATLNNNRTAYSYTVFQHTTTAGVRGFARHVNYNRAGYNPNTPWAGEYEQCTHYFNKLTNPSRTVLKDNLAVRYKQWKNTLRVVDIQYRVRKQDPTTDLSFSDSIPSSKANNLELLAGEERIGAIQPVVLMQNLTNDIQGPSGVNYTPQQLNFQARFRIVNEATSETVYSSIIPVTDSTLRLNEPGQIEKVRLAGVNKTGQDYHGWPISYTDAMNGIPPYNFVQIFFRSYEPSEIDRRNHGRLRCFIIAEPFDPITKEDLGDQWPFDDTTKLRIFVMTRLNTLKDDVTEFHYIDGVNIPSVYKWVSIEAEVQNGDDLSVYPLAPRGTYQSANFKVVNGDTLRGDAKSPMIRLDRMTLAGANPDPMPGGDQIRSFPINLANKLNPVLTLSVQRTIQRPDEDWKRGYSDLRLIGPEPRVVVNFDETNIWENQNQSASKWTDELKVEFAYPSPDGVRYITNIEDARWTMHDKKSGGTMTGMSAYSLYGAGGYTIGFLEGDKDSALTAAQGLRADFYDDGFDWDYKKIYLPIPNYILNAPNNAARNFRFRVRVLATDYKAITNCMPCIPDDDDPFFVDNIAIISNTEEADIEVASVRVQLPYTAMPATQAQNIPITVRLSNNTSIDSKPFVVQVVVLRGADTVYCRQEYLGLLRKGATTDKDFPNWNARAYSDVGNGEYRVIARMYYVGNSVDMKDIDSLNDVNYKDIKLNLSDEFAFEKNPLGNGMNEVPQFTGVNGKGLDLFGYAHGGLGSETAGYQQGYDNSVSISGAIGGNGSGQFAVKFKLTQADTIYGFKAYFAGLSQNDDNITFQIYRDRDGLPNDSIQGSSIRRARGRDDIRNNYYYDQYVTYLLDQPVLLQSGTYWVTLAQLGAYALELGGSASRMAMRTTNVYITPPTTTSNRPLGDGGISLLIDKNFRKMNNRGELVNENFFAFENTKGSNNWVPFMPTIGNPAFAHLDHFGRTDGDGMTYTLTRGTWIPMLRPYFGMKSTGGGVYPVECPPIPIELTTFEGYSRNNGIELFWETATETNNKGFYVDKAVKNEKGDENWENISFVNGAGNSNSIKQYNYTDKNVEANTTYLYRLRQIDMDNSQECQTKVPAIEVEYNFDGDVTLEQNSPNPFNASTEISFRLAEKAEIKLEIVDVFGNVIKTLASGLHSASKHSYNWYGDTQNGGFAAPGSYIYRLTIGDKVKIGKMTLVR